MERYELKPSGLVRTTDGTGKWVKYADAQCEIETADNARRHAQEESTKLVERVRDLEIEVNHWQSKYRGVQAQLAAAQRDIYVCQKCGRIGRDGWIDIEDTGIFYDPARGKECPDCGCPDLQKNTAAELASICTKAQLELATVTAERDEMSKERDEAQWPKVIAPAMYDNPDPGWQDPRVPDLAKIWQLAREVGYAVGLHGSLKRDMDLIAAPWIDEAVGNAALIDHLCAGLPATRIGGPEHKPHGRVAVTLQIDGYYKPIDLSIVPRTNSSLLDELTTLRALILALPKVEGKIEVTAIPSSLTRRIVRWVNGAKFTRSSSHADAYAALLKARQGME